MANRTPIYMPYPFRPFWHPNSRPSSPLPHQEVAQLTQKLDTAEKKVEEYARLIASLSVELRRYQDVICYDCRQNVIRASSVPFPTRFTSQPIAAAPPILSGLTVSLEPQPFIKESSSSSVTQSESRQTRDNLNPDTLIVASPPDNPQVSVTATASPVSADPKFGPASPSTSECANPPLSNPDVPDWSVECNPDIAQGLSLHLVNTVTVADWVYCTKFSHDGKYFAVGLANGETHVYNMTTGSKSTLVKRSPTVFYTDVTEKHHAITTARFSSDNKYIATGGEDGRIHIWEIDRRRLRAIFAHVPYIKCIDLSPNNRFLVSVSENAEDTSVCMWRSRDGSRRVLFEEESSQFTSVAFSPDGRYVAAGNYDRFIRIWDARTCQLMIQCKIAVEAQKFVIFTPDRKGILIGGNTLECLDISLLGEIHTGRQVMTDTMKQLYEFKGNKRSITAASFSPDNRWIVASSWDRNVYILDARNGGWVCTLKAHESRVWGVDFSPVGHYMVSGGADNCVRLWRYEDIT